MGRVLIIKNADFSDIAVDTINIDSVLLNVTNKSCDEGEISTTSGGTTQYRFWLPISGVHVGDSYKCTLKVDGITTNPNNSLSACCVRLVATDSAKTGFDFPETIKAFQDLTITDGSYTVTDTSEADAAYPYVYVLIARMSPQQTVPTFSITIEEV